MKGWFRDTLFLRLFVLMWAALVVSHLAAFGVVTGALFGARGEHGPSAAGLPTFPSLPPTPGVPGDPTRDVAPRDGGRNAPPPPGMPTADGRTAHAGRMPPDAGRPPDRPSPDAGATTPDRHSPDAGPIRPDRPAPNAGPTLPGGLLALDYAIRLLVIGVAAALGARWLARPVRRLVDASSTLGRSLGGGERLPLLDESSGTVEVREAAQVFNRMARELEAQFRSRGLLMASLSHDLKTPLTRMRMRLESEAERPVVQRCIADLREMNELVETALEVFRNADAEEPVQAVDVEALVRSIADDMVESGHAVAVASGPTAAAGRAVAAARPVALRRVFANLLGNAVRYGGRADVVVGVERGEVRVTIDDAGPGIPAELLEAVFQPFFRVEGSRNRARGGSGLGLYIARDLLRRQGGSLTLTNRPAGGLRAEVALPPVDAATTRGAGDAAAPTTTP